MGNKNKQYPSISNSAGEIGRLLCTKLLDLLDSIIKQKAADRQIIQQQIQQQIVQDNLYAYTEQLANDLCTVFRGKRYPRLYTINSVCDIRFHGLKKATNGSYIYMFELDKDSEDILVSVAACQIMKRMKYDIARTRWKLYATIPCAYTLFPFIMNGISITGIKDNYSSVIIAVATPIGPP